MRPPRILLLLAALSLVSCGRSGFLFLDGQGGAQRTRPAGEGRYALKHAVPAAGLSFYLRYRPGAGPSAAGGSAPARDAAGQWPAGAELRVLDSVGGVLSRRALQGHAGSGASEVSLQVALPSGSRIAGFAVATAAAPPPEILEAGLERPFAGFALEGGRLRLGAGVLELDLLPASARAVLASEVFRGERRGWRIELEYELAGRADWADLRRLENGLQPCRRARASLEAAAGSLRAAFRIDALPGARRFFLYEATVGFAPARLVLRPLDGGQAAVRRLELTGRLEAVGGGRPAPARAAGPAPRAAAPRDMDPQALVPLPADPATVLHYDPRFWRQPEYELFAWERFPGILILDTADYAAQDRFFKRLAFFVEKQGWRGRLVTEQEVRGLHGYNAHDYRAEDLARFYAAAEAQGFALNPQEELLRAILAANGLLRDGGLGPEAGAGAILSISRESSPVLRDLLLTHEAFHGLFFTLPRYREACQEAWQDLEEPQRRFWRLFLDWGSYDFHDAYLAANEMQAYLFQQPRRGLAFYFRHLTGERLQRAFPAEAPWLRAYLGGGGGGFEGSFDRLSPVLRREAGLEGGRVVEWRKDPG